MCGIQTKNTSVWVTLPVEATLARLMSQSRVNRARRGFRYRPSSRSVCPTKQRVMPWTIVVTFPVNSGPERPAPCVRKAAFIFKDAVFRIVEVRSYTICFWRRFAKAHSRLIRLLTKIGPVIRWSCVVKYSNLLDTHIVAVNNTAKDDSGDTVLPIAQLVLTNFM